MKCSPSSTSSTACCRDRALTGIHTGQSSSRPIVLSPAMEMSPIHIHTTGQKVVSIKCNDRGDLVNVLSFNYFMHAFSCIDLSLR